MREIEAKPLTRAEVESVNVGEKLFSAVWNMAKADLIRTPFGFRVDYGCAATILLRRTEAERDALKKELAKLKAIDPTRPNPGLHALLHNGGEAATPKDLRECEGHRPDGTPCDNLASHRMRGEEWFCEECRVADPQA